MNDDFSPETGNPAKPALIALTLMGCGVLLMIGLGAGMFLLVARAPAPAPPEIVTVDRVPPARAKPAEESPAEESRSTVTLVPRAGGEAELTTAASILRQRLQGIGIEGQVRVEGGKLLVDLPPGALERTVEVLLAGGRLQFKLVARLPEDEAAAEVARIGSLVAARGYDERQEKHDVARGEGDTPLLLENPGVEGFLVTRVHPTKDDRGKDAIGFVFGEEGRVAFRDLTGQNVGRDLAIVLDGRVQTVARIHDAIDGSGMIFNEGGYAPDELQRLITVMGSGRLPIELSLEGE